MDALADMLKPYFDTPWILSSGIFTLSLVLSVVVRWSLRFILRTVAQMTKTDVDDILIRAAKNVVTYSIPVLGLMAALTPLALETAIPQRMLFTLLAVLLTRGAINLVGDLSSWLEKTSARRTASSLDEGLLPLLRKTLKTIIAVLGVLIILGKWGIQIGPLLGALGIGGLAIAMALNSSLANIFAGIQLILDRSINVGDKVKLESGDLGIVLDIGLRSTRLQTYDNEVISLPNSQLANAQVKNFTKPDATIRVTVDFGVAYGSDIAKVKRVVRDAIKQLDDIMPEPEPQVLFLNMSDFALDMCARVWVDDYGKQFDRRLAMTELVYNTLNESGIEIPFPTRTVYVKK